MRINNNMMAMNTHRQLGLGQAAGSKSMEKLSSGFRINRAGDDAAGLSISEKMRGQIRGLNQASRNAQDGISMIQTAEGALTETHAILQRMRELAVQSSSDTNVGADREAIQGEITQLKSEVDRIANTTEFNTQKLLNGNLSSTGAASGPNAVSGAQVFKQTEGSLTGAPAIAVDASSADFTKKDALVIDGAVIEVDWSTLSASDKAILKQDFSANMTTTQSGQIRDIMEKTINAAIDASGTGVSHIKITDATAAGTFKIESTTQGNESGVQVYTAGTATAKLADGTTVAAASNSVLDNFLGAGAEMVGAVTQTSGTNQVLDAMAITDKFQLSINGHTMQITSPAAAAATDANTYATSLETAINTAIAAYNTAAGFTSDEQKIQNVTVTASDGRLAIASPSGPVELADVTNGNALSKLGLDAASRESGSTGAVTFQIGANKGQTIGLSIQDMRTAKLGISGINLSTQVGASEAIDKLDGAIKAVSSQRSSLGAVQNRLEHTIKNLDTSSENLQASESRIRDVDMAKEMMEFTKNNILTQAAQAMLAQANQAPQGVLQLLR